jgi:hypothetical protein
MDPNKVNTVSSSPTPISPIPEIDNNGKNTVHKPVLQNPKEQSVFREIPPDHNNKFLPLLIVTLFMMSFIVLARRDFQRYFVSTKTAVTPDEIVPTAVVTPNPTADWKTLTNENGFVIKYPSPFKVLAEGMEVNENNATDIIIAFKPGDSEDTSPALHINVSNKADTVYKDMTLTEISMANYEANQKNENTFKQIISPYEKTLLDGKPAYTYVIEANAYSGKWNGWPVNASLESSQKLTVIESENNGHYFIVVYSSDDQSMKSVLSTFKFSNK